MEENGELVAVRATVTLPGLPLGARALVDPSDSYISDALEYGYLVREGPIVESEPEERADTDREVKADVPLDVV